MFKKDIWAGNILVCREYWQGFPPEQWRVWPDNEMWIAGQRFISEDKMIFIHYEPIS